LIRYAYTGRSRTGKTIKGVIVAENEAAARQQLREQGNIVTSLKAVREPTVLFQRKIKLKAKHLALFCRQFSIMLSTGVSLVKALEVLEGQAEEPAFAKVLQTVRLDVASGTAFTKALEKHKEVFPNVFIHLVEAGELAGAMPEVLERLALYYEREDELRKKVSEALMYPTIISVVSVAMVLVLLFVVLPMLVSNFASFGVQTPPITMAVLNARDWMVERWYVVLAIIIALMLAYRYWVRTKPGRYIRDSILLKLPVLGELHTLQILERLMDNAVIKRAVQGATRGVERGEGISPSFGEFKAFPNMLVQMVSVGEETGNLETVLVQLADYYDREVNFSIASFTKLLEPVIMLVLAVVVLFILLSVYLPMMQMVTSVI
jgi:type IV pilus assembly protein PilC